jgi:hypothetical protein
LNVIGLKWGSFIGMNVGGSSLHSGAGAITAKAWSGSFRSIAAGSIRRRFGSFLVCDNCGGEVSLYFRGICVSRRGRYIVRG